MMLFQPSKAFKQTVDYMDMDIFQQNSKFLHMQISKSFVKLPVSYGCFGCGGEFIKWMCGKRPVVFFFASFCPFTLHVQQRARYKRVYGTVLLHAQQQQHNFNHMTALSLFGNRLILSRVYFASAQTQKTMHEYGNILVRRKTFFSFVGSNVFVLLHTFFCFSSISSFSHSNQSCYRVLVVVFLFIESPLV